MDIEKGYCTAFEGERRVSVGELNDVVLDVKAILDANPQANILIFDDATSRLVEVDFRGTPEEVRERLAPAIPDTEATQGPGRPKLGVVPREVTLLPRHWEWLNQQPGGASVALRKLVEEARRANLAKDRIRQSQESAYRFMSTMAGDRAGFEEAVRALYAGDQERFEKMIAGWPEDIREHTQKLTAVIFEGENQ